jgi:hypothetical protein
VIDKASIDVPCPRCAFHNRVTVKQVRLRDVVICRGCKANIRLEDQMNTVRIAERMVRQSIEELSDSIKALNMTLKIKM